MKTFYLDCEFNGFGGELISLALASEDGKNNFYVVLPHNHLTLDPWAERHVVPILHKEAVLTKSVAAQMLSSFLIANAINNEVKIVADWPEDFKHLCELLVVGPGVSVATPNLTMVMDRVGLVDTATHSRIPHNALEDAIALAKGAQ
jgi:hypothetical protein